MKQAAKESLEAGPSPGQRTMLVRLAMLLVFASSTSLAWWSVNHRLLPVLLEGQRKASAVSALSDEVQQLERKWDPAEVERTEVRFKEARASLFPGQQDCIAWLGAVREEALAMDLAATFQPGQTQPHPRTEQKLSLLYTTFDLQPASGSASSSSPYQRVMNFTALLQQTKRRVDLLELSVVGNFNSVRQTKAVVQLWAEEYKP